MKRHFARFAALALAIAALTAARSSSFAATNIVTNGGFETGDLTGWTQSGSLSFVFVNGTGAHTGSFGLNAGNVSLGTISQLLSTSAGATYQLDFWLRNEPPAGANSFQVSWNNTPVFTRTNESAFPYTFFSIPNLLATSASTPLSFSFVNPPSFWDLDDISVIQSASVPGAVPDGGATIGLLGMGILALAAIRRRLQRG